MWWHALRVQRRDRDVYQSGALSGPTRPLPCISLADRSYYVYSRPINFNTYFWLCVLRYKRLPLNPQFRARAQHASSQAEQRFGRRGLLAALHHSMASLSDTSTQLSRRTDPRPTFDSALLLRHDYSYESEISGGSAVTQLSQLGVNHCFGVRLVFYLSIDFAAIC